MRTLSAHNIILLACLLITPFAKSTGIQDSIDYHLQMFVDYEYVDITVASEHLDKAIDLGKGEVNHITKGLIYQHIAWRYQDYSQLDSAEHYFFKSLKEFSLTQSYSDIANAYGNLGNSYMDQYDLAENALKYHFKSLEINEQIILLAKDSSEVERAFKGRAYAWSNLANVYFSLGDYVKSLNYEKKGLAYEKERGTLIGQGISYSGLGNVFKAKQDYDSATFYAKKAFQIFTDEDYANGYIQTATLLYDIGIEKGKTNIGLLKDAYEIAEAINDNYGKVNILNRLIEADHEYGADSLYQMMQTARSLIDTLGLDFANDSYYRARSRYFAKKGNYKEAYTNILEYLKYFKIESDQRNQIDAESAQLKFDFQKKSFQDSLNYQEKLTIQKLNDEKKVNRQRIITVISVTGLIAVLVILYFLYRAFSVKKKLNQKIALKNEIVEAKNKEITDSIVYAQRLQSAILPKIDDIKNAFDSFVMFQPKDVVSGDFYWFEKIGNEFFIAAADCTGHGVPGALVSVVCSNALNQAVKEMGIRQTNEILNKTRELVVSRFNQNNESVKDGMDIALCRISNKHIQFSGANNPLWLIKKDSNELIEVKGDKQPIGQYSGAKEFTEMKLELSDGDQLYLFTDGYADQFGGEKGKKLKYKTFKEILLRHSNEPMESQKEKIETFFIGWKEGFEQIDDVCVIGIRL